MKEKRNRIRKGSTFPPRVYKKILALAKMHGRSFNGELNALINQLLGEDQEETPRNTPKKYLRGK